MLGAGSSPEEGLRALEPDFPHPDAFYPRIIEMLNGKFGDLTPEDQGRIRGLNVLEFYNIPGS